MFTDISKLMSVWGKTWKRWHSMEMFQSETHKIQVMLLTYYWSCFTHAIFYSIWNSKQWKKKIGWTLKEIIVLFVWNVSAIFPLSVSRDVLDTTSIKESFSNLKDTGHISTFLGKKKQSHANFKKVLSRMWSQRATEFFVHEIRWQTKLIFFSPLCYKASSILWYM